MSRQRSSTFGYAPVAVNPVRRVRLRNTRLLVVPVERHGKAQNVCRLRTREGHCMLQQGHDGACE